MNWIVFFQLRTGCLAYFLPVLWIGYFDNFPTVLIRTGYLGMYQASWHLFAKWIKHNFCSMLLKPNKFIFKSPLLWKTDEAVTEMTPSKIFRHHRLAQKMACRCTSLNLVCSILHCYVAWISCEDHSYITSGDVEERVWRCWWSSTQSDTMALTCKIDDEARE